MSESGRSGKKPGLKPSLRKMTSVLEQGAQRGNFRFGKVGAFPVEEFFGKVHAAGQAKGHKVSAFAGGAGRIPHHDFAAVIANDRRAPAEVVEKRVKWKY